MNKGEIDAVAKVGIIFLIFNSEFVTKIDIPVTIGVNIKLGRLWS